jgi:hypothetical protein
MLVAQQRERARLARTVADRAVMEQNRSHVLAESDCLATQPHAKAQCQQNSRASHNVILSANDELWRTCAPAFQEKARGRVNYLDFAATIDQ